MNTRRYGLLPGPSSSPCGRLRPRFVVALLAFYAVKSIFVLRCNSSENFQESWHNKIEKIPPKKTPKEQGQEWTQENTSLCSIDFILLKQLCILPRVNFCALLSTGDSLCLLVCTCVNFCPLVCICVHLCQLVYTCTRFCACLFGCVNLCALSGSPLGCWWQ